MISVVVPIYNAEKWLEEALSSIVRQTYSDFEVILVNDGSADGSENICKDFLEKDKRFRLINQSNRGLSGARNRGLDNIKGEWVFFMDADDVLPTYSLESLLSNAINNGVDIVVGRQYRGILKHEVQESGNDLKISSEEAIVMGLYQKRILNSACGVLFKSDIFNGEVPLRFRKTVYEDLDLFYLAFEKVESICIIDRPIYYYRKTPGSIINTWNEKRLDVLDVTDRIVAHMQGRSASLERAAADRRFSAHFNMLIEMERSGVENIEQKERCLRIIRKERLSELKDRNVRLKNKIGALISYFGMPLIKIICKLSR